MKKIISLLLSIVMLVSALSATVNAFAAGWASNAESINLNTWYNDYIGSQGYYDSNTCYYANSYKMYLPSKGKITIRTQNERTYFWLDEVKIYKTSNIDSSLDYYSRDYGYSSGGGYYWNEDTYNLSQGYYYIVLQKDYNVDFDFKVSYKPIFSSTSLTKVSAKDNAFFAKWNKCSNISGYQLQYSTNSNMSSSKKVKIGSKYSSKTVKSLKNKKKYYVRVRTYKTVSVNGVNKTFYSKWSSKKTVKTK